MKVDFEELSDKEKSEFGKEILKRWKNLRDSFAKSEKKMKEGKASGSKTTRKRKYIFNDELQFLKKIYSGREVTESHSPSNEEEDDVQEVTICKETDQPDAPAPSSKRKCNQTRKHKQMDEIDIKVIKALECPIEKPNSKMLFFQSLLPDVEKFNDYEMLQFQMWVLQGINRIANKQRFCLTQCSTPVLQQPTPYYNQFFPFSINPQQQFINSQNPTILHSQQQTPHNTQQTHLLPNQPSTVIRQAHETNFMTTGTALHKQQSKITSALSDTTTKKYVEDWLPHEDTTDRSSSLASNTSSMTLEFCNL